jgi:pentatricopeptide repeat protein
MFASSYVCRSCLSRSRQSSKRWLQSAASQVQPRTAPLEQDTAKGNSNSNSEITLPNRPFTVHTDSKDEASKANQTNKDPLVGRKSPGRKRQNVVLPKGYRASVPREVKNGQISVQTYWEWGYLRHQYSRSELPEAKRQFSKWKKDVKLLSDNKHAEKRGPEELYSLLRHDDAKSVRGAWEALDLEHRKTIWPSIMISVLREHPEKALLLLEATYRDPLQQGYAIQDAIQIIALSLQSAATDAQRIKAEALTDLIIEILNTCGARHIRFRQNVFYHITSKVGLEKLEALYDTLEKHQIFLHHYTLCWFAYHFAQDPVYRPIAARATSVALSNMEPGVRSAAWASVCTELLSTKKGQKNKSPLPPDEVLGYLLQHGFTPNLIHYTTLLQSLCREGELDRALEVFEVILRTKVDNDPILFSTMLNAARERLDERAIKHVVQLARERNATDALFWNDLLQTVVHFAMAEANTKHLKSPRVIPLFNPLLQLYARIFELGPLQTLLPVDISQSLASGEVHFAKGWDFPGKLFPIIQEATLGLKERLSPPDSMLRFMLLAYVLSLSKPYSIISLYANFRRLLVEQNEVAKRLIQERSTFVYDIITNALCAWPGMFGAVLDIIGDMLKDNRLDNDIEGGHLPLHSPPSHHTWNILLKGYMASNPKKSAQYILTTMQRHGVKPDVVTWNTLISGYSRLGKVQPAVRVLKEMEQSGYAPNETTVKALSSLINKDAIIQHLEGSTEPTQDNSITN